jgi:hypothetical protein
VALALWIALTQSRLLYLPDLPARDLTTTPDKAGLAWEPARFATADGFGLGAWYIPAEGADTALLFLHGSHNTGYHLSRAAYRAGLAAFLDALRDRPARPR